MICDIRGDGKRERKKKNMKKGINKIR